MLLIRGGFIFELIIMLCRYLFIFYIVYFLILGIEYLLDERGIRAFDREQVILKQKINIILMHITAFIILAYNKNTFTFDNDKILVGVGGFSFLIYGFVMLERVFKKSCPLLWNGMFFLLDVSLIVLERLNHVEAKKQLLWMFLGVSISFFIPLAFKIIKKIDRFEKIYAISSLLFLFLPFIFSITLNGAKNWIDIFGFRFQPSELSKILLTFYLAVSLSKIKNIYGVILPGIVSFCCVIMLVLQKDLGGALIFFMIYMVMMYIATGNNILFGVGIGSLSIVSVIIYKIFGNLALFSHLKVRMVAFLYPWNDFHNKGFQIMHSLFAIGTWGLLGSGLTRGIPNVIPINSSDFIFAAICEEFGGIFAVFFLAIFVVIYYRGVNVSLRTESKFFSLLISGLTSILVFQTFLIVGGVIKFIPLTGVTLPFVSYGGSSILVCIFMIGLIQQAKNINYNEYENKINEVDKEIKKSIKGNNNDILEIKNIEENSLINNSIEEKIIIEDILIDKTEDLKEKEIEIIEKNKNFDINLDFDSFEDDIKF